PQPAPGARVPVHARSTAGAEPDRLGARVPGDPRHRVEHRLGTAIDSERPEVVSRSRPSPVALSRSSSESPYGMKIPWTSKSVASAAPATPPAPPLLICSWPISTTPRWVSFTEPATTAFAVVAVVQVPPTVVETVLAHVPVTGNGMSITVAASVRLGPL